MREIGQMRSELVWDPRAIVLASASPRRLELLRALGFRPVVAATDVEEVRRGDEGPEGYVRRLAGEKAAAMPADAWRGAASPFVLAADTVVVVQGQVLEKPRDDEEAVEMLRALGGRTHQVWTGVAVRDLRIAWPAEGRTIAVQTLVTFGKVSAETAALYVATGEPRGKAGAYAIQGIGGALVERIEGSYANVVGLPVYETVELLKRAGAIEAFPFPKEDGGLEAGDSAVGRRTHDGGLT